MADGKAAVVEAERAIEMLPALFSRLTDQLTQLFEAKLALVRAELKEELSAHLRSAVMIFAGGVITLVGFALLNFAIAFLVSMLFENTQMTQTARYALGFIITAVLYLAIGSFVVLTAKNRMAKQGIVPPKTAAELERDKEWIEKQI